MKKKVLIVIQLVRRGGVELVAINLAKRMNKDKYDITFLLINPDGYQNDKLSNELLSEGYTIDVMPNHCKGYYSRYKYLLHYFKEKRFDVVHSHVLFFSGIVLTAAKKRGVKIRAAHSHATEWNNKENLIYKLYKSFMRLLVNSNANYKFACSIEAGEFMYGKRSFSKDGIVLNNGISTDDFAFDNNNRSVVRKRYDLNNEVLIGHVGTIYRIKNQVFLVKILYELINNNYDCKLILVGEKVDISPVVELAKELNVEKRIILVGETDCIADYYSAMDIMIFPSLHEAFPLSLIEAQAASLPCLVSDSVTKKIKCNVNVSFLSLNEPPAIWAEEAINLLSISRNDVDLCNLKSDYDINSVVKELENYYDS